MYYISVLEIFAQVKKGIKISVDYQNHRSIRRKYRVLLKYSGASLNKFFFWPYMGIFEYQNSYFLLSFFLPAFQFVCFLSFLPSLLKQGLMYMYYVGLNLLC